MKHALAKQITLGLMTAMIAVSPVFAETTPSMSRPVDTKGQPVGPQGQQDAAEGLPGTVPAGGLEPVAGEPAPSAAEPREAAQPNPDLAPYLNKTITRINIEGNQEIAAEDIQKAVITNPGLPLTEETIAKDLQSIYALGWFYDLRPSFTAVPEGVQVTYHVMENPKFSRLAVEGNTKLSTDKIAGMVDLPQGQMVNIRDATAKLQQVEAEYKKEGYILARITDVKLLPDGTLNVQINEGKVEDFKVKGNVKTKDHVILREIRLKKGEPFNSTLARRSMQRIYNLGFFEDVNVRLNPGSEPNAVEMEITVVEMNTGTFGIGAGYSDADGFIGMITLGDKNFRGSGDNVSIRWEFGGADNRNYEFNYTKPWLDKRETSGTLSIYNLTNEYADYDRNGDEIARYDKKRVGQELTFGRKEGEFVSNYLTLKHRDDKYDGAVDGYSTQYYESSYDGIAAKTNRPATAAERRAENFGETRSIGFSRVYDSRDNIYDPHSGKRNSYTFEWGGLGGDFKFEKLSVDYRYYLAQGPNVIAFDFAAGYAWGDMPLSQRFAMGGSDTLRGYEDDQFKGNSMLRGTVEYRVPIIKKVQGVLFVDSGYAWDKRDEKRFDLGLIKVGYGLGLRINSPLGPIKLDYGIGEDDKRFHFSFGGQF